jgi:Flp pilus assembly protein TadG
MKITHPNRMNGQSLVELALLLPVLLVLTIVTFDLGRGIYYYSVIYNAAREGARYGIIHPEDVTGIEAAAKKLAIGLDQSKMSIDPEIINSGKSIQVTIDYTFELVTPMANLLSKRGYFDLRTSSTMLIER